MQSGLRCGDRGDRCQVQDDTAALSNHRRYRSLQYKDRCRNIDSKNVLKVLYGVGRDRAHMRNARTVDEDID